MLMNEMPSSASSGSSVSSAIDRLRSFGCRAWPAEQIALRVRTAGRVDEKQLIAALDPLGHSADPQARAKSGYCRYDGGAVGILGKLVHE